MSHIAQIGRRSWRVRAGMAGLYALLVLGAVTTVYPFLLMVSIGTKSQTDYNDYAPSALLPRYLHDDRVLYAKYVEDRYANNLDDVNAAYHTDIDKIANVAPPADTTGQAASLTSNWTAFTQTLPPTYKKAGFGEHDNAPSALLLLYRAHLRDTFGSIDALNKAWTEENLGFDNVTPPFERTALREWTPDLSDPKVADWTRFKTTLPPQFLLVTMADPLYRNYLKQDVYEDDLARLNTGWGTSYKSWSEITLPPTPFADANAAHIADWETFVRTRFPLRMLGVSPDALPAWRAFLQKRARAGSATATLPATVPLSGDTRTDWMEFVARVAPLRSLTANSSENLWRSSARVTGAMPPQGSGPWETPSDDISRRTPPQAAADWRYVQANAGALRWDFATRNFKTVGNYIFLHGAAVGNTIIFCLLAIGGAIIVNPLCAYALSRYPLPYAYKVLLFLLATMAFPAEVAMIPNFLLIKDLGLLNTFGALVLPGLASGFSIFLLKGFFDSLPRELYEAGILDGATEIRMFQTITVPLSLPIFSVIALNAFTASYGAFLFAMVVCQDPKMWTLMVWLYNLQDTAPQYMIMAALTLAALPTLIVFMFAQKIIMRGVILPSFK